MADIKTRDVTRGTIKTLDRGAGSMSRVKEQAIRTKAAELIGSQDDRDQNTYAQDAFERSSVSAAAYAASAGVEIIQRNRQKPPEIANDAEPVVEKVQRAAREQGVKSILGRHEKAKMADAEVLRNTEERRLGDRVSNGSMSRISVSLRKDAGKAVIDRQKPPKTAREIQRVRKEYAVRRIAGRRESPAGSVISLFRSKNMNKREARRASGFLKIMWENARTTAAYIGAGGASIVIILTLLVFFGIGAITFSNNSPDTSVSDDPEAIEYFIPDLTGSPTRMAIVKAAAREVGNVGGEKFWRWYGFKSHVHWCACFTSYIAAECGCIQSGICPKASLVGDWISFYKKQHRWAPGSYIPHSGDFIIFDWEGDGEPDHIGIVESCDGKTVHTIEGNSSDVCRRRSYARGSSLIYGYCCPNYSGT